MASQARRRSDGKTGSKRRAKTIRRKNIAPVRAGDAAVPGASAEAAGVIDMDAAIELLGTSRPTFYRWLRAGKIKAMKAGRQWRFYRADIERFLKGESPRIDVAGDLSGLLEALASKLREAGLKPAPAGEDAGVTEAVNRVLLLATAARASDIHFEPPTGGPDAKGVVRLRLDGVLHELAPFDGRLIGAIIERLKTMAGCDPQQKRRPQDGRIGMNIRHEDVDLRASFVPALFGEAATLRLLRPETLHFNLGQLPFAPKDLERIRHALAQPWGMIVVTAPTGSGTTTTLYCALQELNQPGKKVMSVEDPVEYAFAGVVQVPVNAKEGVTYAAALRSVFRCDPDAVLVGELRDFETAQLCTQLALTGHTVLTSMHTNDAPAAFLRLADLGLDPSLLDAVKLIVAQRLIRSLCKHCGRPVEPSDDQLALAAKIATGGGVPWDGLPRTFREAVGCKECHFTGYRGRTLAAETLAMSPQLAAALRNKAGAAELRRIAVEQGMTTMAAGAIARAAAGETTLAEALRVIPVG